MRTNRLPTISRPSGPMIVYIVVTLILSAFLAIGAVMGPRHSGRIALANPNAVVPGGPSHSYPPGILTMGTNGAPRPATQTLPPLDKHHVPLIPSGSELDPNDRPQPTIPTSDAVVASVDSSGRPSADNSFGASISASGTTVVFVSFDPNLGAGTDPEGLVDSGAYPDVFVHDLVDGRTIRLSVGLDGTQANGSSRDPTVSADGRLVAFASEATNLTSEPHRSQSQIYVRDIVAGTTTLVSKSPDGSAGDDSSFEPQISADGRSVVFASNANNLVDGPDRGTDVYLHDLQTSETTVLTPGDEIAMAGSSAPSISADGRFVSFATMRPLDAGDSNGQVDIYLLDREMGEYRLVSVAEDGTLANGWSSRSAVSDDGRILAIESDSSNLTPGDENDAGDIFLVDLDAGTITRISAMENEQPPAGPGTRLHTGASISGNGRFVSFTTGVALVPGDTNDVDDVVLFDRQTERLRLSSHTRSGVPSRYGSFTGYTPRALSSTGDMIVFTTGSDDIAPDDRNERADIIALTLMPTKASA